MAWNAGYSWSPQSSPSGDRHMDASAEWPERIYEWPQDTIRHGSRGDQWSTRRADRDAEAWNADRADPSWSEARTHGAGGKGAKPAAGKWGGAYGADGRGNGTLYLDGFGNAGYGAEGKGYGPEKGAPGRSFAESGYGERGGGAAYGDWGGGAHFPPPPPPPPAAGGYGDAAGGFIPPPPPRRNGGVSERAHEKGASAYGDRGKPRASGDKGGSGAGAGAYRESRGRDVYALPQTSAAAAAAASAFPLETMPRKPPLLPLNKGSAGPDRAGRKGDGEHKGPVSEPAPQLRNGAANAEREKKGGGRTAACLDRVDVFLSRPPKVGKGPYIAINHLIVDAASQWSVTLLLEVCRRLLPHMNSVNVTTALHRLAKFMSMPRAEPVEEFTSDERFVALRQRAVAYVIEAVQRKKGGATADADLGPWCLSIIAWAHAIMEINDAVLFESIAYLAADRLSEFKQFEISNVAWAFAKAGVYLPSFFQAVGCEVETRIERDLAAGGDRDELSRQCVSALCWSFGVQRLRNVSLIKRLGYTVEKNCYEARPLEIAYTAYAFASLRVTSVGLFLALSESCKGKLYTFKPQELTDVLWAFARLQFQCTELFMEGAGAAIALINSGSTELCASHVATLTWSFAKLEVRNAMLYACLFDRVKEMLQDMSPQQMAQLCWAVVRTQNKDPAGVVQSIVDVAITKKKTDATVFTPKQLAGVIHSATVLGIASTEFCTLILDEVTKQPETEKSGGPKCKSVLALISALTANAAARGTLDLALAVMGRVTQMKDHFSLHQMVTLIKLLTHWAEALDNAAEFVALLRSLAEFFRGKFVDQCKSSVDLVLVTEVLSVVLPYEAGLSMHELACDRLTGRDTDGEVDPEVIMPVLSVLEDVLIDDRDEVTYDFISDDEDEPIMDFSLTPITVPPPTLPGDETTSADQAGENPLAPADASPSEPKTADLRRPLAARLKQSLDNIQATNDAREAASRGTSSEEVLQEDQIETLAKSDKISEELASRVRNELSAMVDEIELGRSSDTEDNTGPGSRSTTPRNRPSSPLQFVHPKELTSQMQTLTVEQDAERAPNIIYYKDQKVFPSKHHHAKKMGSEFPVESLVVPVGVSVVCGQKVTLLPHFENGSIMDVMRTRRMEIPEVLMLVLSVIRRLPAKDKSSGAILPESPEHHFRGDPDADKPTETDGYDEEKGRQALGHGWKGLISSHAFLHPSQILLGTDNLPYFNTYMSTTNVEKYHSLCPPERAPVDREPLTEASVVYSMGVLMYSLLVGSLPEPTPAVCPQDFGVSLDNIAGLEPHFSRHDGPGRVVVEMVKLIRQCLKMAPEERPTLRAMADTLRWLSELSRTLRSGDLGEVPENSLSAWSSRYNKNTFLQIGPTRADKAKKRSSSC